MTGRPPGEVTTVEVLRYLGVTHRTLDQLIHMTPGLIEIAQGGGKHYRRVWRPRLIRRLQVTIRLREATRSVVAPVTGTRGGGPRAATWAQYGLAVMGAPQDPVEDTFCIWTGEGHVDYADDPRDVLRGLSGAVVFLVEDLWPLDEGEVEDFNYVEPAPAPKVTGTPFVGSIEEVDPWH